jgi:hypothetical protein
MVMNPQTGASMKQAAGVSSENRTSGATAVPSLTASSLITRKTRRIRLFREDLTMRRFLAVLGFGALLTSAAVSLVLVPNVTSKAAASEQTFLIPASDGYGVADCLTGGSECGKVVANAWCEAKGFGLASSFGLVAAEDVTGATDGTEAVQRPISITCAR